MEQGGRHFKQRVSTFKGGGSALRHSAVVVAALWFVLLVVPVTRAFSIRLAGFVGFWGVVAALLIPTSTWRAALRMPRAALAGIVAVTVLFAAFTWFYLARYSFAPTWDEQTYWYYTLDFNDVLRRSVIEAFHELVVSIFYMNYNYLMSWVLSLPVAIAQGWSPSMFALVLLFLVPAALMVTAFVGRLAGLLSEGEGAADGNAARADDRATGVAARSALIVALFTLVLCAPVVLHPAFDGLMDAPAYVLFLAVTIALVDRGFTASPARALAVGIGVCGTFLLRRYFFYGVMGLAVGAVVLWVWRLVQVKAGERGALFKRLLRGLGIIVAVFLAVAVVFYKFIYMSLFGGQTTAYQAYFRFDSLADRLSGMASSLGIAVIVLALVAMVALLVRGKRHRGDARADASGSQGVGEALPVWVSCLLMAVVTLGMFWRTQDLGMQHWYLFIGQAFVVLFAPLFACLRLVCARGSRPAVAFGASTALVVIAVAGLAQSFTLIPFVPGISAVLPMRLQEPRIEADLDERRALISYLTDITGGVDTVYFTCASWEINSTLPIGVVLPASTEYPIETADADVDLRDGFNTAFFDASYVVATNPVQTHLVDGTERIVETLNRLVQDPDGVIGAHYELLRTFAFADGLEVYVYERVEPFSADDVAYVQGIFDEIYPEHPELFHDRFEEYLEELG